MTRIWRRYLSTYIGKLTTLSQLFSCSLLNSFQATQTAAFTIIGSTGSHPRHFELAAQLQQQQIHSIGTF